MRPRRRSVLLQVALLVLIPLIFLVGSFAYAVTTAASSPLPLNRSKVVMDQLRLPIGALPRALDLAASARSQADGKLRNLYLIGGLCLAAVVVSLALSLWIAVRLTRRLRRLRDSAVEMANTRLPPVVQQVRTGENVDVAAQMPLLEPSPDEIGQVPRTTPAPDPQEPLGELDTGPASSSVAAAPDEPHSAGSRFGLTENDLPQRNHQMSPAPQPREPTASPSLAEPAASSRSPETARSVMSAFRQGWRSGLAGAHKEPD